MYFLFYIKFKPPAFAFLRKGRGLGVFFLSGTGLRSVSVGHVVFDCFL